MVSYKALLIFLTVPAAAAVLITLGYLFVYKKRINARLEAHGKGSHRPILTPLGFFLRLWIMLAAGTIGAVALLYFLFAATTKSHTEEHGNYLDLDYPVVHIQNQCIPSMLDSYTPGDEISGYTITDTVSKDGLEIYFYASAAPEMFGFPDAFVGVKASNDIPDYLVDIEFTQENTAGRDVQGGFSTDNDVRPRWLTVDTISFFGVLDITAKPKESDVEGAKLTVDLAKAYDMEADWKK